MESYFIPYKNGGGTVVDWDFQSVIHCVKWNDDGIGYAQTTTPVPENKHVLMHRLLLNFPNEVDHINGKRNDNRDINLRSVTHRENGQNQYTHRNGRLVGTYFRKDRNKWQAKIEVNGEHIHIGTANTEMGAHLKYKKYIKDNNL
jgi:N-acetylglucosamine-6-phosphate deacetylase